MRQMLLQNATAILLQNATEVYYKMRQVFYYKMRQFYYKMQQLLQNATFITDYLSTANNAKEVLDPVDKATFKYMICPSIFTIKNV